MRVEMAKMNAPAFLFDEPEEEIEEIQFSTDIAQFRNEDGSTRLEIFTRVQAEQLFDNIQENNRQKLQLTGTIRDTAFISICRFSSETVYSTIKNRDKKESVINGVTVTTPPHSSEIAFQLKTDSPEAIGFTKQPLSLKDFSGNKLLVSDIQIFTVAESGMVNGIHPHLQKDGILVSPYPYTEISRDPPMLCYFEIYNLKHHEMSTGYKIELEVIRDDSKQGRLAKLLDRNQSYSMSVTHSRTILNDSSKECISLDLSKLTSGDYILKVTVRDSFNSQIMAVSGKEIKVRN